jgi:hypothetical protein
MKKETHISSTDLIRSGNIIFQINLIAQVHFGSANLKIRWANYQVWKIDDTRKSSGPENQNQTAWVDKRICKTEL